MFFNISFLFWFIKNLIKKGLNVFISVNVTWYFKQNLNQIISVSMCIQINFMHTFSICTKLKLKYTDKSYIVLIYQV